ncbi:MAG TPA: HAD family phosphatase [Vicinamibacterales bacterium]|nr:HAD family phosphatase [Vicinamibacterales bacterium]
MPLRAIIFDFDGVIANSEPLHLRAFQQVLADEGLALAEHDYYARYLGHDDVGVFRAIGAERGTVWTAGHIGALVGRKAARLETLEADVSILFPGAADAIRRAAAEVPIGIASGALGPEIRRVLDREGLTRYFTVIVSAEDTSVGKPAPEPYLHAVAQLAAARHEPLPPSDCVAVEDSVWGLESARIAGLVTVGVAQTYEASELAGADLVIPSLDELALDSLRHLYGD